MFFVLCSRRVNARTKHVVTKLFYMIFFQNTIIANVKLIACIEMKQMSLVIRNPAFCICENKDANQFRGDREADQRLCFRYIDSTINSSTL